MFCFQCQETAKNSGCTIKGVCGKKEDTANLQDVLVYMLKGLASLAARKLEAGKSVREEGRLVMKGLFATITNANFDNSRIEALVEEAASVKRGLRDQLSLPDAELSTAETWDAQTLSEMEDGVEVASILATSDEDIRSLRETIIYGLKGLAAYGHHAYVLGYESDEIYRNLIELLGATTKEKSVDELFGLVVKTGQTAASTMELLDRANTETYGNPEITSVNIGVGSNPGILISGHDLKDMEELLKQTEGTGVDVYTHSEMLPANYYPAFKKYKHFVGNYGNAWWKQGEEFDSFNGAILMTTNCIIPVKAAYRDRIFTTGMAGYPDVPHIEEREDGQPKDFSPVIKRALSCQPPKEIEKGTITGGFAHHQVTQLADKVVDAVKSGAIKRFVVMAGCDGRQRARQYFTDVAEALPQDAVVLTAGCAKYRYNKLNLGDIAGIPRVLDAGQCNDSYSIAVIAMKLKEIFGATDVNELPVDFDIAWYEQKAVAVLLALLALGFRGVRIGPTLPAFLSPAVAQKIVESFDLKATTDVQSDVAAIMA